MTVKYAEKFEFIIVGFVDGEHFTVLGRCGDLPIRVGDTFDALYRYEIREGPVEQGDGLIRERERPVSIKVACIHALNRSLKMMGQGMTGSLVLEGDGCQYISPGWVLGRRSEGQGISEADRSVSAQA